MAPGKDREKGNKRAGNRQKDRSVEICTEGPASSSQDASNLWSVTKLSGELLINKQQPEKLPLKKRQSLTNIQIDQNSLTKQINKKNHSYNTSTFKTILKCCDDKYFSSHERDRKLRMDYFPVRTPKLT